MKRPMPAGVGLATPDGHKACSQSVYAIMGTMAATGEKRYQRPPVRMTVFTVYFRPFDLDLSIITALRNEWAERYPGFKQVPPRIRRAGLLPAADPFSLSWPMPAAHLVDSSLARTLAFQFDQFSLTWNFDTEGGQSRYPGYDVLAEELIARFTEFTSIVNDKSDSTVTVDGCKCFYTNAIADIGGHEWLTSYLSVDGSAAFLEDASHFGFRLHREDEVDSVRRSVVVQMDAGREQPPEVDISAVAVPSAGAEVLPAEAQPLARILLDLAHDLENQTFEASFNQSMKSGWETL